MKDLKKVTVVVPADLLEQATTARGKGITATIRAGLEAMVSAHSFEGMRRLRGRVNLLIDVGQLRRD